MAATLGTVERSVLKALAKSKQTTVAEIAAMLPSEGTAEVDQAKAALLKNHLVEAVPGSPAGALRLTAEGTRLAETTPDEAAAGSGGGESTFD